MRAGILGWPRAGTAVEVAVCQLQQPSDYHSASGPAWRSLPELGLPQLCFTMSHTPSPCPTHVKEKNKKEI